MRVSFLMGCLLFFSLGRGQKDCYLCLGMGNNPEIVDVFELDSLQRRLLDNLSAELKFRNRMLEDRAKYMLLLHEQSSPEDLLIMSFEYRAIMDSMFDNVRMIDRRLLAEFTDNQYNRYINLCNKIQRSPIYAPRVRKKKKESR